MKNPSIKLPEIRGAKPEISMAPLIDVIFLLLIFFMVTTVFPENRGIVINKPSANSSERMPVQKLSFLVANDDKVYFKNQNITIADVKRIVEQQLAQSANTSVLLKIDRKASAQAIISTMDACKEGGAQRIGIATKKADENRNPS